MTTTRRFTISVSEELGSKLQEVKQTSYEAESQNEMMRDLIVRGIAALKKEGRDVVEDSNEK